MSVSTAFFDQLYAHNPDPWAFRERWYEQRKRALTLATLPRQQYTSVFEVGCANGELSAGLAQRTQALLACDAAAKAVLLARERLKEYPQVDVRQSCVPQDWPSGQFELIVISEVAYYLDPLALDQVITHVKRSLTPNGHVLACHWRPPIDGCMLTGDLVHAKLHEGLGWPRLAQHMEDDFILEVWARDPISVASLEGLR